MVELAGGSLLPSMNLLTHRGEGVSGLDSPEESPRPVPTSTWGCGFTSTGFTSQGSTSVPILPGLTAPDTFGTSVPDTFRCGRSGNFPVRILSPPFRKFRVWCAYVAHLSRSSYRSECGHS